MSGSSSKAGPSNDGGGPGSNKNKPVESLTEIFRCFICMEKLRGAHMCSHCSKLCCYTCIQRWLETSNHCPHCRSSLLSHEVIKCRWAEEVTQQLDTLINAASSSSAVPGLLIPDKTGRSGTSLLDSMMMTQVDQDQDKERCVTHAREQLSVYCTTCKQSICHQCALWSTNHHGHIFKPIDEIYHVQCQSIKEHVIKLRRRLMELIGCVQEIDRNIDYATTTKDLHVREIRSSVEQMIGRLDSYLKTKLMTLVNQKGHLNRKSEEIDNLLQDIERQLSSCPKSELISVGTKLVSIIEETLQRCTYTMTPVTIDFQSEIIPKYSTCNVIVNNFSALREKGEPFYSESMAIYGHVWRLKIYPNGNGVVRGSYLSLFLELTAGPSEIAKYEYRIEMIYQNGFDSSKNMLREFSSDFEVGECWGYNRFFRLDLLDSEGFRIPELDVLQFRFDVRPTTYYQKCKDMDWYIQQLKANQRSITSVGERSGVASSSIESSLSPLLNELSSRMGKLVVKNTTVGTGASSASTMPTSVEVNTSNPLPSTSTNSISSFRASSHSPLGTDPVASSSKHLKSSSLPSSTSVSDHQLHRHPSLGYTSPTTASILHVSSYLANNSNQDKENDNPLSFDSEIVPSSSFYDEYLQICGGIDNTTLPENYVVSPDENDDEEGDDDK